MNAKNMGDNELTSTLADRAERFTATHGADLSMDRVLARAGEIRRARRNRATMAMAAAVLALAVPAAVTVLNDDPTAPRDPAPAAPVAVDETPISLDGLRIGAAPRIGYADGSTLRAGDVELPLGEGGRPNYLARLDGGFIVGRWDGEQTTASFVADDGTTRPDQRWPIDGGIAVSQDGALGALVTVDGTVVAVQDGGSRSFELGTIPRGTGFSVDAVAGSDCSGASEATACTVYVSSNGEQPEVWAVRPSTTPSKVTGLIGVADVSGRTGDVAGQVSYSDEGSCSDVLAPGGGRRWGTCENLLESYSPDGRYLLGSPAYGDGPGAGLLTVLDADTGKVLLTITTTRQTVIPQYVWEDDTHLLTVVQQGERYGVVRIGVDGSRELTLPVASDEGDYVSPFLLTTR